MMQLADVLLTWWRRVYGPEMNTKQEVIMNGSMQLFSLFVRFLEAKHFALHFDRYVC